MVTPPEKMSLEELLLLSEHDPAYFGWREEMARRLRAVSALHKPMQPDEEYHIRCSCQHPSGGRTAGYPCPTRRKLEGEK